MYARVDSFGVFGIQAYPVQVEATIVNALPAFEIVGLPGAAVKESRDRVKAACLNCDFTFPLGKITVNLAPADMKKEGPLYDLPIFIALLQASGVLPKEEGHKSAFMGELSLNGEVRPVNGVLSMVLCAKKEGFTRVFIPRANALEGAVVSGIEVYAIGHVCQLVDFLTHKTVLQPQQPIPFDEQELCFLNDFADVKGQYEAKRAAEICASGGHNMLLIGPPGAGKSMIASRMASILPPMCFEEAMQTTQIYSVAGKLPSQAGLIRHRPFRAPHHSISPAGLCGGGATPKPGELSLAHNGVLFLDELPEFSRTAMEILRQPLESGEVTIARARGSVTYPCKVMFIAAMNPCPCGYFGHPTKACTCSPQKRMQYIAKVSGPLLDRVDIHVEVLPVPFEQLADKTPGESSREILKRVIAARAIQQKRYASTGIFTNAQLDGNLLQMHCKMTEKAAKTLKIAFERTGMSARGYTKVLKVARTIADMEKTVIIDNEEILEAIQYRSLDRKYWGCT